MLNVTLHLKMLPAMYFCGMSFCWVYLSWMFAHHKRKFKMIFSYFLLFCVIAKRYLRLIYWLSFWWMSLSWMSLQPKISLDVFSAESHSAKCHFPEYWGTTKWSLSRFSGQSHSAKCYYTECHCTSKCCTQYFLLNVILPSVFFLNVCTPQEEI